MVERVEMKSRQNNADFEYGLTDVDGRCRTHKHRTNVNTARGDEFFWKAAFYSHEKVELALGEWL